MQKALTKEELNRAAHDALTLVGIERDREKWSDVIAHEAYRESANFHLAESFDGRYGLMQLTTVGFNHLRQSRAWSIFNPTENIAVWVLDKLDSYGGEAQALSALSSRRAPAHNPFTESENTMSTQFEATPTVTITAPEGTTYSAETMTIKSTMLGIEDHGIPTFMLHCEGNSSGIGVGGYRLSGENGITRIFDVLRVVGVDKWESLVGKQVYVLFNRELSLGERAVGIANPQSGKVLVF